MRLQFPRPPSASRMKATQTKLPPPLLHRNETGLADQAQVHLSSSSCPFGALKPACAENFLPWSVTGRPLRGEPPTIDLVIGYNKTNTSPILSLFLSRVDQLKKRTRKRIDHGR